MVLKYIEDTKVVKTVENMMGFQEMLRNVYAWQVFNYMIFKPGKFNYGGWATTPGSRKTPNYSL